MTYEITPRAPGAPDMSDPIKGPVDMHVAAVGVYLVVAGVPILLLAPNSVPAVAARLAEAGALWEKHYRAFVHDGTGKAN